MKVISVLLVFALFAVAAPAQMLVGGIGEEKNPDADVQKIVNSISDKIKDAAFESLTKSGANTDPILFKKSPVDVLSYKTQVVAGTNYFAKIRISDFIFHARIYRHFSGSVELTQVVGPKSEMEQISYF